MDPSSPAKRRALAPLDKNAMSPTTKLGAKPTPQLRGTSPSKPSGLKRPLQVFGADENGAAKKQCQEPQDAAPPSAPVPEEEKEPTRAEEQSIPQHERTRSSSPDAPSVFDNSITEGSQEDTTLTEPDAATANTVVAPPPRPRRVMTREQARQSAEILRLRLGLANYKVRTGQTDVPLERLEVRPIPGLVSLRREVTASQSAPSSQESRSTSDVTNDASRDDKAPEASQESNKSQKDDETSTRGVRFAEGSLSPEKNALPRLASALNTPQRARLMEDDEKLTSSALRGGAANGLLSLARGR